MLRSEFSVDYEAHAQYIFLNEIQISNYEKKNYKKKTYFTFFLIFLKIIIWIIFIYQCLTISVSGQQE